MRLNFAANGFVFARINRDNEPISLSVHLTGRELPKCV